MARQPTMEDVAARAGVSRALVSLVMRDSPKVSPARRAAVLAAAEELGYSPHAMARGLASRTSTVLAVLVSDLRNPYFGDIMEGLDERAREAGLQVIVSTGGRRPHHERAAIETLLTYRPAALVLLSPVVPTSVIVRAAALTPVVAVERALQSADVDLITDDGQAGSALAVDHLVALGHRAIVHLDGGRGAQSSIRRRGFLDAMARHGLAGPDTGRQGAGRQGAGRSAGLVEPSEYTELAGELSVGRLLAARREFTAIVAANDINAIGAINALEDHGLRVPQDVSVVGYDNTSLAALRHVGLTTVDQPRAQMGRLAVETVLARIAGSPTQRHTLTPTLVVRTTTGPLVRPRTTG